MKSKRINPIILLYEICIFLPVFSVLTILTAVNTIFIAACFGDVRWGYVPARIWAKAACILSFVSVEVRGIENFDPKKSYVFVANHQSIFDVFLIYGWLDSKFKWILKKELRNIPLVGKACEAAGHIFIDRSHPMAAHRSIEIAAKKLTGGSSVVIFPEGSRTKDGQTGKFKRGAFLLASDLKLPIVPITISGGFETMPKDSFYIKPGHLKMTIHAPIETENYQQDNIQSLIEKTHETICG